MIKTNYLLILLSHNQTFFSLRSLRTFLFLLGYNNVDLNGCKDLFTKKHIIKIIDKDFTEIRKPLRYNLLPVDEFIFFNVIG